MSNAGYGRGGRGAALLMALNQPVRKVGQAPTQQDSTPPTTTTTPTSQPPPVVPMGRGAMLASLRAQQEKVENGGGTQAAATPAQPGLPRQPLGRGLGLLQPRPAPTESGEQPAPVRALGRGISGMSLLSQRPPSTTSVASAMSSPPRSGVSTPMQSQRHSPPTQPGISPRSGSSTPMQSQRHSPPTQSGRSPPNAGNLTVQDKPAIMRHGTSGKTMPLSANYIRVECLNKGVYQYAVSYEPIIDSKNMRYRLLNEHRDVIGETRAFDGNILFLPIQLSQTETVVQSVRTTDNTPVTIRIKLVKILDPESCTQVYNIIFRRIMGILKMCQVGRHYYDPRHPAAVPQHKLEVWPGYITAINQHEGGLMLLTDVSHRVLRTETVLDILTNMFTQNKGRGFQEEVTKLLIGTTVLTRYNNKTYRVDDIAWDKNPMSTFQQSNGELITFKDYYKKSYNRDLTDNEQPLLINRPKKREQGADKSEVLCLIPELSYMTGLTDAIRSDFRVMKDLSAHTRVSPAQRQNSMRTFIKNVNQTPEAREQLERWGLRLQNDTIQTEGRLLPMEKIHFNSYSVLAGPQADWGRDATSKSVIQAVGLNNWLLVFTPRDRNKAMDFADMMKKCTPAMGIEVRAPTPVQLSDDRTETFLRSLRDSISPQTQCVVIVCPTSRDDRYNAIKKLCCVECPVPSQVINARTISQQQKLRSVTQKVALQINCKLGGELWALDVPMKSIMVVGIDVYHEGAAGGKRGRSVCGFVASMNNRLTRWYSRVVFQMPNEELSPGLKLCLTSAIKKYHEINHELPMKIVVYRDGVGDGQLDTVAGYEVQQLEEVFHHFGESYDPKMAVVIVQKRINTRIFLKKGRDNLDNPPPGTVIDHTVTRRDRYDFFLVSQHVRQGTVSPTHYIVVHDNINMNVDHMQRLAYKLTHLYYNWPGTIRVPAPCQYAHKLAYLVGQNIRKEPSPNLCDRLFFL